MIYVKAEEINRERERERKRKIFNACYSKILFFS